MPTPSSPPRSRLRRALLWSAAIAAGGTLAGALALGTAMVLVSPQLPDVSTLTAYQPKLPMRVYTADGVLIGEFGEERRQLTPVDEVPKVMKDAILAIEDARFYEHGGVDARGVARAVLANLRGKREGASTITMQVARNVYLSSDRTVSRKFHEVLLALRLEAQLSKDQILEIYLNQIYLGQRAYGFASAAQTYFGKPLQDIGIAEAAMLAGLPKAPSTNNPVSNPRRAQLRQHHVIDRMQALGFIGAEQAAQAKQERLVPRTPVQGERLGAEHVAEAVRQQMLAQYGESAYTRGLKVYTTLVASEQAAAYHALRQTLMDYTQRQRYRGPEHFIDLPADPQARDEAVDEALAAHPDRDDLVAAVVLEAGPKEIRAMRADGETLRVGAKGLQLVQAALSARAAPAARIRPGAVIRVRQDAQGVWHATQLPEVEGAFVALDPRDGAVRALVGGFDYGHNQFNHATQAWRQPGSSFKPFIYSAALEKGLSPATVVDDAPLFYDRSATGSAPWAPKNYGGDFEGPMSMQHALEKSKNMVTIRVLEHIGTQYAQDWVTRFGFDRDRHPAYLPMALGAGAATPMQMAAAYAVFANGGLRVNPSLVIRVTDHRDRVLADTRPARPDESQRAIPPRNAFVMNAMLQGVMQHGTGRRAWTALARDDLYGKTGTTNNSFDAWFAGFQPTRVGVAWIGYDTPRQLGVRGETGGSLGLPVWTAYMKSSLQGVPVAAASAAPEGVVRIGDDWHYDEWEQGFGVARLGAEEEPPALVPLEEGAVRSAQVDGTERSRIMDLFR